VNWKGNITLVQDCMSLSNEQHLFCAGSTNRSNSSYVLWACC